MSLNIIIIKTRILSTILPLIVVLAGCGKGQIEELQNELANDRAENERLQKQLAEQVEKGQTAESTYLSKIQDLESSLTEMKDREKAMYAEYRSKLSAKNKDIQKIKRAYIALKSKDQTECARLSKLMVEKQWDEASEGLKAFISAYPNSEFLDEAQKDYSRAVSESRQQGTQESAAQRREEIAQRDGKLKSQIENGELTPEQIKPYLMGKTPQQVRDFLGEPSSTYTGNKWRYTDQVFNPDSGVKNSLKIQFNNGVVTLVDYWGGK